MVSKFNSLLEKKYGKIRGAQTLLANDLKISQATIACWATGRNRPSIDFSKLLAKHFGVSLAEILEVFDITIETDNNSLAPAKSAKPDASKVIQAMPLTSPNTIQLPILADVPAGLPEWSDREVEVFVDIPRFLFPGSDFIIRCIGDSLEPELHIGDYCVIRKTEDVVKDKPMLVETEDGYVMKLIKVDENGEPVLCSTNPKYKPFKPKNLRIVGQILGMWRRMDRGGFF